MLDFDMNTLPALAIRPLEIFFALAVTDLGCNYKSLIHMINSVH